MKRNAISERILQILYTKDMTQAQLAKLTYFSRSHISNVINGRSPARDRLLIAIAFKCNISFNWLKSGTGNMNDVEKFIQSTYTANLLNDLNSFNKKLVIKFAEFLFKEQNDSCKEQDSD